MAQCKTALARLMTLRVPCSLFNLRHLRVELDLA